VSEGHIIGSEGSNSTATFFVEQPAVQAELLESGMLRRVLKARVDSEYYIVAYEGNKLGYEQIRVNGKVVTWKRSWLWFVPRFEFLLGSRAASVDVQVWPWFAIKGFQLILGDEIAYKEGRPTKSPLPRQFSLRALLIATTMVAVALGLILLIVRSL
jgi:hypothetical protein